MSDNAYNPEAWRAALRSFIDDENLTVNGWAKKAGISEGGLRDFLSGRNKSLSIETLEKLAAAVGLKHNEILKRLFDVDGSGIPTDNIRLVPVVTALAAGGFAEVTDEVDISDADEFIPVSHHKRTLIAVRVSGTSINRFIPDGALAVIDYSDTDLVSGSFYAIKNGSDEVTLKRYRTQPDRFEPYSTDPHDTIFLDSIAVDIIGKIVHGVTQPPK